MPWLVTTGPAVLYVALFAAGFTLVALALGRRITRWLGLGADATLVERGVLSLMLGAGALSLLPFALGIAGALTPFSLRVASAVVALAAAADASAVLRRAFAIWRAPREPYPAWFKLWLLALAPGLIFALLSALTPTIDPDGLGYHLTVPKRWLALGSLGYLPTYPYSNTPMAVEMLFTLGLGWVGDTGAKVVHLLLGAGAAVGLYAACKRVANDTFAALAVALLLYGPFGIASLMGWAYVEAATSCALVGSGLAWLIWYQHRDMGYLRAAGLLAGVGVSSKLTAGLFPVALSGLTLLLLWREAKDERKPPLAACIAPLVQLLVFVVVPVLPWFVRSAVVTGNPVFPMFASLLPSRDFTAEQSKAFDQYNRYMVWGVGAGAAWGLAKRKMILAAAAGLLALAGFVAVLRQKTFAARSVAGVVLGTVLVQLLAAGLYKRYWIPLLSIVELPLLLPLGAWLVRPWVRPALVVVTGALSLVSARQALSTANGDVAGLLKTSLGLEPQADFVRDHQPLYPLYEKLNRESPPQANIVLAAYCGGFYIDRTTLCVDIVQSSLRLSTWPDFVADLKRLRVSHVIMPLEWSKPSAPNVAPPRMEVGNTSFLVRPQEQDMVGRVVREHGHLLVSASDQGLYAVDLGSVD